MNPFSIIPMGQLGHLGCGTVPTRLKLACGHHFENKKDLKFAEKVLKGRHFRASESYNVFMWIGNQILPHFDLLKSFVAQRETEIPSCSDMQH